MLTSYLLIFRLVGDQASKIEAPLNPNTINPGVANANYAVRGKLAELATKIRKELESGSLNYPFKTTIQANLGNPQGCGQRPITFFRQVLCLAEYPEILDAPGDLLKECFMPDATKKAKWLLQHMGSLGAYSSNSGVEQIRESVSTFISSRDRYPSCPNDIFLTCGAFEGMLTALTLISGGSQRNERTGVLLPVPFYPVYLALLSALALNPIPYYLNEEQGWAMPSGKEFASIIRQSKSRGITPRCIIIINPNNPTGAVYGQPHLESVIELAAEERLLLLADEVYQENVFPPSEFKSCKFALRSLQATHAMDEKYSTLQLISLQSVSKGMVGEGGQRGGYFEAAGFSPFCKQQIQKLVTYTLQPTTVGQVLIECMVNPPQPGQASYPQYKQEYDSIFQRLKQKAEALYDAFKRMPGIVCQAPRGAIYEFPQVQLPPAAVAEAMSCGESPDTWYCMEMLKATGICVVPGSGFGMSNGTIDGKIWFRITFLGEGEEWIAQLENYQSDFMARFRN